MLFRGEGKKKEDKVLSLKELAVKYVEKGEYDKALSAYESLLLSELDKGGIHNTMGDIYEKLGNPEEALSHYEQAIELYAKEDQFRSAIGVCKKVLRYHKDKVEMHKKLADLYTQEGRIGDAILALNEYAERVKDRAQVAEEIKEAIVQLKEKSILMHSAVEVGQKELDKAGPFGYGDIVPKVVDEEEEARRLEEERLMRELEEEIERELEAERDGKPLEKVVSVIEEKEEEEITSGSDGKKDELVIEPLEPEKVDFEEETVTQEKEAEVISDRGVALPVDFEKISPVEAKVKEKPEEEVEKTPVKFVELEELGEEKKIREGTVFAELSSKPYDSEHFHSRFDQELSRAERYGRNLSFVLIQVGLLKTKKVEKKQKKSSQKEPSQKQIALVRKLGDIIRSATRDIDIVAYNADGRIVLILPETPKDGAIFVANRLKERINHLLEEKISTDEKKGFSIGIISFPKDADTKEKLVWKAQRLMEAGNFEDSESILMLP